MLLYPSAGAMDLVIHPRWSGSPAEAQMLDEALAIPDVSGLKMFVFADNTPRRHLLNLRGVSGESCRVHFGQSLSDIPVPALPDGFRFLERQADDYAKQRAALHAEAFTPSSMTADKYRALMQAPGYDPMLDVVIASPDGRPAAFAMAWADPVSQVGLFEPVGTSPDFQRRGLGRAALLEGMRRLQAQGMNIATVRTNPHLPGVMPFYESAGFRLENTLYCYGLN
jgi:mycothiol synthase